MNRWQRLRYQPNLPLGADGKRKTASKEHRDLSKNAAKEGMVLLKNNQHLLPLPAGSKVALFGKGSFDYVKGGGGSGDVTVEYTVNLYEGMKALQDRVSVFEPVSDFYRENVNQQYAGGAVPGMTEEPSIPENLLTASRAFTDTAVISISRYSGEGWDRKGMDDKKDQTKDGLAQRADELFESSDFYLTKKENEMVNQVKDNFSKVIVVLNVGSMVDTSWFAEDDGIQAVLMAWQGTASLDGRQDNVKVNHGKHMSQLQIDREPSLPHNYQ